MISVDVAGEDIAIKNDEQQIRQAIDAFAQGVRAKDLEAIMALYASDVVAFDMVPPLKFVGKDVYRRSWAEGLEMMAAPIGFEIRDLQLAIAKDVAFAHSLNHMSFTAKDGSQDGWMRWSAGFRKIKSKWLVTHEHLSVPYDMHTGKALWGLKP